MEYLWEHAVITPRRAPLTADISADVLVIGGGMAGVLCARALTERGAGCLLVEAKTLGSGVTKGTTAVLTAQHDTLYTTLIRRFGIEKAKQYLDANLDAVGRFRRMAEDIPCDFEERPSLMYSRTDAKKLEREVDTLRSLGFSAEFTTQSGLPFSIAGAVRYPSMAQFHPLKFLYGAAKELHIYENTFVRRIEDGVAYTDKHRITAKHIIVATHFPFINRRGLYFMKMHQRRSFVLALENVVPPVDTCVETGGEGMYFRSYGDLFLVGGGDRRPGGRGGGLAAVRDYVRRWFPQAREKYAWAAQDCMSLDGVPYIGRYSSAVPNLYVATGFNEWGMTSSMAAAQILADAIEGRENPYAPVFSPQRSMLRLQLAANLGATLGDFVLPTPKRCPHLGCALRWNPEEKTWECPCHGSRFDAHGHLINNPAMRDAKL